MSQAILQIFGHIFNTEECKTLRPIAIANLAFSTINYTILTFTFSSKLSGKYSVGAIIFLTINKGGSGKSTQELKGAYYFIHNKSQTVQPPSLISNEQSLKFDQKQWYRRFLKLGFVFKLLLIYTRQCLDLMMTL